MPQYTPPLRDLQFVLHELLDVTSHFRQMPRQREVDRALVDQLTEEGGKFCAEVLFPLNRSGDEEGCTYVGDGVVRTPRGFKEAWQQFVAAGWPALTCDPEFGGQGLPYTLQTVLQEMMNSANQAWTMYPGLTHGAYDCLLHHGTPTHQEERQAELAGRSHCAGSARRFGTGSTRSSRRRTPRTVADRKVSEVQVSRNPRRCKPSGGFRFWAPLGEAGKATSTRRSPCQPANQQRATPRPKP